MKLNMGMMAQLLAYTGNQFMKDLGNIVVMIVSIAGAFMTLYAVYIGYLFATASDANKRKAAKDRLIKVVASALIIVALAAVLGVINVNFNSVDGGRNGQSAGNTGLSPLREYKYNGTVTAESLSLGQGYSGAQLTGKFDLDTSKITCNGDRVSGVIPQNQCSAYNCKNASFTQSGWTVDFTITASTIHSTEIDVHCERMDGANGVILVTVEFRTQSTGSTVYSFNVEVIIPKTTNVKFYL